MESIAERILKSTTELETKQSALLTNINLGDTPIGPTDPVAA